MWMAYLVQRMAGLEERVPVLLDSKRRAATTSGKIPALELRTRRGMVHQRVHSGKLDVDNFQRPGESDRWRHQSEFLEWVNLPFELHLVLEQVLGWRLGSIPKDHVPVFACHLDGHLRPV